jgi:hypothetical protein
MISKQFIEIFVAKKDTVVPDPSDAKSWRPMPGQRYDTMGDYIYFQSAVGPHKDKRILIVHGTEFGVFPPASHEAIAKYNEVTDMIYCCYPAECRRVQQDNRIQGFVHAPVRYWITRMGGEVVITLKSLSEKAKW